MSCTIVFLFLNCSHSEVSMLRAVRVGILSVHFVTSTVGFGFWTCSCTVNFVYERQSAVKKLHTWRGILLASALWTVAGFQVSFQNLNQ